MGRTCSTYGTIQKYIEVLVGKPKGNRPLGRLTLRWADIKMDLKEVGCDPGDWINFTQDRDQWCAYAKVVINLWFP